MLARQNSKWCFITILLPALVALLLCLGCGEDEKDNLPVDEVAAGWNAFQQARYETAMDSFRAAVSKAPGWGEPYSGLGWCYLAIDSPDLAEENFEEAVDRGPNLTDAWAGLSIVKLALGKYQEGGVAAREALQLGQDKYFFRYDPEVDVDALRVILAECAFYLGDLQTAEEQVELIDLQLLLDSSDPDYEERLLEAIARLSRQ